MSAAAAAVGAALDAIIGEPPARLHPVALYGKLMTSLERRLYRDSRAAGAIYMLTGLAVPAAAAAGFSHVLGRRNATAIVTTLCAAGRMLDDEALAVARLLDADQIDAARARLQGIVGRDTRQLDTAEIARAAIESVAENGVDAVTSTLWWATLGGSVGAALHRACNTLDAMVGHRNGRYRRFGSPSARLDDIANYLPARLSALAVALAAPSRARTVWRTVRSDAGRHPSPNGGVIEAAYAAALNITLGGTNRYGDVTEDRGRLGNGPPPGPSDIVRAVRLRRRSTAVLLAGLIAAERLARSHPSLVIPRTG